MVKRYLKKLQVEDDDSKPMTIKGKKEHRKPGLGMETRCTKNIDISVYLTDTTLDEN